MPADTPSSPSSRSSLLVWVVAHAAIATLLLTSLAGCGGDALPADGGVALDAAADMGQLVPDGGQGPSDAGAPRLVDGQACETDLQCASGFCTDGVCCESRCDGECAACAESLSGAASGTCAPVSAEANRTCRPASTGGCDVAETCDGVATSCPVDTFAAVGTECRGATTSCDAPEVCPGDSALCPADTGVLRVSPTFLDPLCHGDLNGSISASPLGGTPPYTYEWSTGATSSEITNLGDGTYSVTVTDANSCQVSRMVFLFEPPRLTVSTSSTPETCPDEVGTATAAASGGTPIYAYEWSHGPTTATASGLGLGTYSVTATDVNGCSATAEVTVSNAAPLPSCDIVAGAYRTETQGGWGSSSGSAPVYLAANFASAFPAGVTLGCNNTLQFTNAAAINSYLPCSGTNSSLNTSLINPGCQSNTIVSQLLTAELNMGFDAADPNFGSASAPFADLIVAAGPLAGLTVAEVINEAHRAIGGCGSSYSLSALNATLTVINQSFIGGAVANGDLECALCSMSAGASL